MQANVIALRFCGVLPGRVLRQSELLVLGGVQCSMLVSLVLGRPRSKELFDRYDARYHALVFLHACSALRLFV